MNWTRVLLMGVAALALTLVEVASLSLDPGKCRRRCRCWCSWSFSWFIMFTVVFMGKHAISESKYLSDSWHRPKKNTSTQTAIYVNQKTIKKKEIPPSRACCMQSTSQCLKWRWRCPITSWPSCKLPTANCNWNCNSDAMPVPCGASSVAHDIREGHFTCACQPLLLHTLAHDK